MDQATRTPVLAPNEGLSLMEGEDLVCVSVMDWDWPFWTSRQQLMTQFARKNRVLFVNPPLTFASDYRAALRDPRLRRKLTAWAGKGGLSRREGNLFVWSPPPAIPFHRLKNRTLFDGLLSLNQRIYRRALQETLDRAGFRRPILWISFEVFFGDAVLGRLREKLSVYHCTDEISGFPGLSPFISEVEKRLAARSDLVLVSSESLRDAKALYNSNTHFVPNGADVELFQQATCWTGPVPADLLRLPSPRAGFVGQVEHRFDADLLCYAARHMPTWSFALIGPLQEDNRELDQLRNLPNVHFLGLKDRGTLPGYLAFLDVALIPYKINRLTESVYPLKLHEYLAAGKPVVATPIPSLRGMSDMVYLAEDGQSFVEAIQRAAREDSGERRRQRAERTSGCSWTARAKEISKLLKHDLQRRAEDETEVRNDPLPLLSFLRLGSDLRHRHTTVLKRLVYRFLGDPDSHRRIRTGHVLRTLAGLELHRAEVLDAGCGEGASTLSLARTLKDCRVTGVDIDREGIGACRRTAERTGWANLAFRWADLCELPFAEQFDAAVCVDVLEHIQEDELALRNLHRALKPGGRLVVHLPMRHQLQQRFIPSYRQHEVEGHVRDEYCRPEIAEKLERAGFRVDAFRTSFGSAGELAFELNTLFQGRRWLRGLVVALTYPLCLLLGYLDVASPPRDNGNSFLIVASKANEDRHPAQRAGEKL